jgi:hypothetical protein
MLKFYDRQMTRPCDQIFRQFEALSTEGVQHAQMLKHLMRLASIKYRATWVI